MAAPVCLAGTAGRVPTEEDTPTYTGRKQGPAAVPAAVEEVVVEEGWVVMVGNNGAKAVVVAAADDDDVATCGASCMVVVVVLVGWLCFRLGRRGNIIGRIVPLKLLLLVVLVVLLVWVLFALFRPLLLVVEVVVVVWFGSVVGSKPLQQSRIEAREAPFHGEKI